jgi:DNA-directed RNA polymerase specialized sigma24 family protein
VQEVLLRAWRSRDLFQGRSSPRTWLYRVATNACLDTLRRAARRAVPAPAGSGPSISAMPWVQPYPDSLLDEVAADQLPQVGDWNGLPEVGDALRDGMTSLGQWRLLPIMANRQPGAAGYLRRPG